MKTRLYIAGPMTGLPEYNFPAFRAAQQELEAAGYECLNPVTSNIHDSAPCPDADTWTEYMRNGFNQLIRCHGIALLPGWEDSPGATAEHALASTLAMPAATIENWIRAGNGEEAWAIMPVKLKAEA